MILTRKIGSQSITVECAEVLQPAACDVLETLAELAKSGTLLRDGLRVQFGWSLLTLRAEADGLRVCEPRFSGDPRGEQSPTLDITLSVLAEQVRWLHRMDEKGKDVVFDQKIVHTLDGLEAEDIFALRGESTTESDSGWSVARVPRGGEGIDMSNLSGLPIYRLLGTRVGLLAILTLPEGYLVRLQGNEVTEITDAEGRVRWPEEGMGGVTNG